MRVSRNILAGWPLGGGGRPYSMKVATCAGKFSNKKNPHATDPNSLLLFPSFFLARFSHARTHTHTPSGAAEEKKCCAHTTHTRTNFPSNFVPSKRKFDVFFPSIFRALENSIRAENPILSSRTQLSLWNCQSTSKESRDARQQNREISPFANSFFFRTLTPLTALNSNSKLAGELMCVTDGDGTHCKSRQGCQCLLRRRAVFVAVFPVRQGRFSFKLLKSPRLFDSNDVFVFIMPDSEFTHVRFNKITPH